MKLSKSTDPYNYTLTKEDWLKLDSFLWRFFTDFTHWVHEKDLKEARGCLETAIMVINNLEEKK